LSKADKVIARLYRPSKKETSQMKADLLKAERIKRGWTQAKVAEALGVDAKTVGRWERGKGLPYPYYREQLCLLFNKTAQQLGLLSEDKDDLLEDTLAFGIQSTAPSVRAQASFLVDPTIPQLLESATSFVGREDLLMEVKERLLAGENVALTAMDSLPGIGKTALAAALAMDQQVRNHFRDGILWAGLGPRPNVLGHLVRWGMLLGVVPSQVENVRSREAWGQALRAAIGNRRLLLIISDAWTAEDALSLQVGGIACAHVLTTRLPDVGFTFDQQGCITIGELEETERIALLTRFVPDLIEQDPKGAHALVQALGGLPLTLTLMGSYLASQTFPAESHPLQTALALLHETRERWHMGMPGVSEEEPTNPEETMPLSLHATIALCEQQLSPQVHTALHALSLFLPKSESFSEEVALAVTQQPVKTLDALCDAGLLEVWGPGRYFLHQAIANHVRIQDEPLAAGQQQRMQDANDSWLTNLLLEAQESNDLTATASAQQQHKPRIDKIDEMILSLPKNRDSDIPLKTRISSNRWIFLVLVPLCLAIIASGIYATGWGNPLTEPAGRIGYWPFNEGSGTTTLDTSGNGNLAQIHGATWTTGRYGNALSFNGSSDTVDINRPIVETSNSFSVAAWVQLSNLSHWQTAVSQDGNNVSGFYLQYAPPNFGLSGQFAFSLVASDSISGPTIRATSNFSPVANTWYHLVGVYNAATSQSSLYVNGVLRSTQMVPSTWDASGETVIGRGKWARARDFWSGQITNVRIYNRALSSADVTSLYQSLSK
jgi:transcriptional regulator with XRE-family HTH domain